MDAIVQRKRTSFRLREDLLERLRLDAQSTNLSLNSYVENILMKGAFDTPSAEIPKKQYLQHIEDAIADVHAGNCFAMEPQENLDDFLDRMEAEGNV